MQIKISEKILSIPPYISTNWSSIVALHMQGDLLAIKLNDGTVVTIPNLPKDALEQIFNHHAAYLEKGNSNFPESNFQPLAGQIKDNPLNEIFDQTTPSFRLGFGSVDGLGNVMQHNPQQSDAPDLPPEIVQKIGAISKILVSEELVLPKAEPSCNCFYCQIARAINPSQNLPIAETHEEVTEADLHFQQWDISQTGDKLFSVTNHSDENEKYNVFLGEPLGCTCGKQGCEHIIAVLKS